MRRLFNKLTVALLGLLLLLAACVKEYPGENCGKLNFDFVWNETNTNGNGQTVLILMPDGTEVEVPVGNGVSGPNLPDGTYQIVSYEKAEHIIIKQNIVSVDTLPDGTIKEPEHFSAGVKSVEIINGMISEQKFPMFAQTRQLIIKVKFIGGGALFLDKADGLVDGIALSRNIQYGFPPEDGKAGHPALTSGQINLSMKQDDSGWFNASRRLLGIDGSGRQNLRLGMYFTNGTDASIDFDITKDVEHFHTQNVTEPLVIEIILNIGADFTATIEDWKSGPESWLEAN